MKLIFASDNRPVSRLIKVATSCKWHHVAVAIGDTVIEARFAGVSTTTMSEIKSRGEYHIVDIELNDEQAALDFAVGQVGKPYDFAALIGFKAMLNLENPNKWYCSELAAAIANAGGVKLVRSGLSAISPRDLWCQNL